MHKYALLILLFSGILGMSQNCDNTFSGSITDLHDGTPLVGATLVILNTKHATITDFDGNFSISDLCNQTYSIQISHLNCQTLNFKVKINGNTQKSFKLEHHIEELNEIHLSGKGTHEQTKTIIENKISTEALERFNSGTLGDALNSLSGVSSLNTGNTVIKPIINGLHSSRVVIINNGVRMEDQEWGAEHAPNIDINSAGSLTLIKGAGALQYSGDAVGGVIISEAARIPVKDTLYGKTALNAQSNGRGGTITSQITKSYQKGWYTNVQGTLKRFGDFEAPDYVLSNTGVSSKNASVRAGLNRFNYAIEAYYSFFNNEIGILRASHQGGAEDLVNAINSDKPLIINDFTYDINAPKQAVKHHLARLKGFKKFDGLGKLSLQYDFQQNNRLEFDIRRGDDKEKAALDLQLSTHTLKIDLNTPNVFDKTNLKTGILTRYQKNFANPNTGVRRLIPDYKKYELGYYAVADYKHHDNWLFEAGGRFDYTFINAFKYYRTSLWENRNYDVLFPEFEIERKSNQVLTNPQFHFYNLSATLGTTYTINKNNSLFFNYSIASRAPNPSEFFSEGLHHSASRIELGDLRFKSEMGNKLSLTLQRKSEKIRFSVNPYLNIISNFIVLEPTGVQQTVRGNFQVWEYRQTDAQLLGIDVDASYQFAKNFRFDHQFSLVKGYDRTKNLPLINMPPVNTKNEIIYQKPEFNNIRVALQSEYVFRQNEYPNTNFEVFIPESQTHETIDVSTPPNAYHLLHLNSSLDFKINTKSKLTVGFGITNLFNTTYRNYLNRFRYYTDDLKRNYLINIKINY